jgi:2'-5' RNA ligase
LPDDLLAKVKAVQDKLDRRLSRDCRNFVRWTAREQLHLTLKFYGNVHTAELDALQQRLRRAAGGISPFELGLAGLGCFPSAQRPNVIWIDLEGQVTALGTFQARVERETAAFGNHSETRPFHPHLTVGRVKAFGRQACRIGEAIGDETLPGLGTWTVGDVALVRSQLSPRGSIYTCLARIPLSG